LYVRDLANLRAALRWASETMDARSFAVMHEAYDVLTWTFTGERDATFVREAAEHATGPVRDHLAVSHLADRLEAPSTATHELPAMEEELRVIATRAQRTDDTVLAIRAQWILADAALRVGGPGRAEPPARAAVRALDRPSRAWERIDRVQLAYAWRLLAKVAEASGRYGAARHDLLRSIALFRSVGDPGLPELSRTLRLDVAYGRYAAARRAAGAAHRCLPPDAPGPARTHVAADRARLAVALGEIDAARAACGEGLAIAAGLLGEIRERYLATLHGLLAHAALLAGEVEAAERHLALAPLDAANRARRADTLLLRGDSHAALDDLDQAAERVTAPALQPFLHGYVAGLRVRALEAAGREGEATEAALAALRWARGSGMPPEIARAVVGAAGRLSDDAATPREAALREVAGDPRSDATGRRWARAALRSAGRTLAPHDAAAVPALLDELERALAALAAAGGSAPARSASSQRSPAVG
jgi:tetratricopeptide (TPR) repeat protein